MADTSESEFDETVGIEIQGWILALSAVSFEAILRDLELTPRGTPFARVDRLYRRLRGDYTAADFVGSETAENELASRTRREQRLCSILKRTNFSEETLSHIALRQVENLKQADESGFAPLANSSANISETQQNAEATAASGTAPDTMATVSEAALLQIPPGTAKTMTTTTSTYSTSMASSAQSQLINSQPRTIFSTTESKSRVEDTVLCKLADGTTYTMPRKLAVELIKAQKLAVEKEQEVNALKLHMAEVASSTQIIGPTLPSATDNAKKSSKSVNFQDTFDLNYIDANAQERQEPEVQPHRPQGQTEQQRHTHLNANAPCFPAPGQAQQQSHISQTLTHPPEWPESGRGGYPPGTTSDQTSRFLSDMSRAQVPSGDVGRTVRQWKVRFAGEKGESIEEFIQRVEECRRLAHISDADLLNALSELLSGVALHWCRHSRVGWNTWADFCRAARRCYGVEQNFQQRLIAEAQARKQGRKEPARDYIFCLLTIFSRLEAPPSTQYQLDMLYANMLPALRMLVPKERVTSVEKLVQLAREAEELLEEGRNFPAPLSPEQSVLPSVAYKEPEEKNKKGVKSASDRTQINIASIADSSPESLAEIMSKLLDEKLKTLGAPFGKSQPRQAQVHGPRWTRKREAPRKSPSRPGQSGASIVKANDDGGERASKPKVRLERNRNQNNAPGPRARVYCFLCGWPGHIKSTCPECSGNEKRGE